MRVTKLLVITKQDAEEMLERVAGIGKAKRGDREEIMRNGE